MSEAITRGIKVKVKATFIPQRSSPEDGYYFFAYRVRITNEGDQPAQLLTRHWIITDGSGEVQHVKGAGVIGEQPLLEPGDAFEYTSFCPLPSRVGTMHGSYGMKLTDGEEFDARIAPFRLAVPGALH